MRTVLLIVLLFATVWWLDVMWFPCRAHGHSFWFCAASRGFH